MKPKGNAMPDLSSQIETLYRVICQSEPVSSIGPQHGSPLLSEDSAALRERRAQQDSRWSVSCRFYCLWFSLPLSIWLTSGWIGLLFYWQVLSGAACLLERLTGKQKPARASVQSSDGDAICSPIEA